MVGKQQQQQQSLEGQAHSPSSPPQIQQIPTCRAEGKKQVEGRADGNNGEGGVPAEEMKPTSNGEVVEDAQGVGNAGEEEEEEEEECGFCLFMKGGGCKEAFIAWEKCVEEGEKNKEDIVEKCFEVTVLLKKCMEAHTDYYEPILKAEKSMEEEAAQELEQD